MAIRRAQPWLGTLVEISAAGPESAQAVDSGFDAIRQVHRLMSIYEPESDVSRINSAPLNKPFRIDPHTYAVLSFAGELSRLSAGAFDITVGRILMVQQFLPPLMPGTEAQGNYRDIELLPDDRIMLHRRVTVDLGGIAKGYAVDCAINAMRQFDIQDGQVNAGGDLRVFGAPIPVHVRHPATPGVLFPLPPIKECAIASSSGYYSNRNGIDPLVDPAEQQCVAWLAGITVVAPTCMAADALTKVVRLRPEQCAPLLIKHQAQALVLEAHQPDEPVQVRSIGEEIITWH